MAVLVTGGAGYIGSTTVSMLMEAGEQPVVLDNLSYGHRAAVDEDVPFYQGDFGDAELVKSICEKHQVDACIHFAAFIQVGESVANPAIYYENNTANAVRLLTALKDCGVKNLVFSSTAATYGEPVRMPIDEEHPQRPENAYGWSKYMVERILDDFDQAYGFKSVALRYFNACGAITGKGEDHSPESHLIPLVLFAAMGKRDSIKIFGTDYDTEDGTCVRDYIHVADLAQAHILAIRYLRDSGDSQKINLGNGNGYTVRQVIETAKEVTGLPIKVEETPRRPGDTSHLIADSRKARDVLGWDPKFPELKTIIATAWEWHQSHPNGYNDR